MDDCSFLSPLVPTQHLLTKGFYKLNVVLCVSQLTMTKPFKKILTCPDPILHILLSPPIAQNYNLRNIPQKRSYLTAFLESQTVILFFECCRAMCNDFYIFQLCVLSCFLYNCGLTVRNKRICYVIYSRKVQMCPVLLLASWLWAKQALLQLCWLSDFYCILEKTAHDRGPTNYINLTDDSWSRSINSVTGVSLQLVLDCGTIFYLDYGGRDSPSILSDDLWKLTFLATEAFSDSFDL